MLSTFICGSGSFSHEDKEDDEPWASPCSTPKRSRKNSFCRRHSKENKNPYSNRGLDKFSALVADLDQKRQRIYSQLGSQEPSLVRFVYSSSNDCVPIVVKLKDSKAHQEDRKIKKSSDHKPPTESSAVVQEVKKEPCLEQKNKAKKRSFSWNAELGRWRRPVYYLPAAVILILVFLAVFGRSAAVVCTSVGWYLVPALQGESSVARRSMKKKEYAGRLSDKKMVKSAGSSPANGASPLYQGHRKSF